MVAKHSLMTDPAESSPPGDLPPASGGCPAQRVRVKDAVFAAIDEAEGYKATQLAEAAGVTDATLSSMRHQGRDVRMSTLQRLLDAMPTDVYLRFYRSLGDGLVSDVLGDEETAPDRIISALFRLCDDQRLMALVRELGALSKERHEQGSKAISVMALLMELMQYCDLEDIPELIGKVGKYTSTAISRASENPSEGRR
jgi:transcriptional regulator with XRE-family HTH domain